MIENDGQKAQYLNRKQTGAYTREHVHLGAVYARRGTRSRVEGGIF
jgi:hypothetical protein